MTALLLNGKHIAEQMTTSLKTQVQAFIKKKGRAPGLAVILLGDDPASLVYVNNKRRACGEIGIGSFVHFLDANTEEHTLIRLIETLNHAEKIDGILVQLPLPEHINTKKILGLLNPAKDVDGFHPFNLGRMAQGHPLLRPCTPWGIIQLLKAYDIPLKGKHAVVIGASNIVGRPMALEFLLAGCTVTVCHRFTPSLEQPVRQADIIVLAAGKCDIVDPNWLHENQIVIDVGIHRLPSGKLRGDIDFEKAFKKVAWITPVPGGVGPMTIVTLLQNTLIAAYLSNSSQ